METHDHKTPNSAGTDGHGGLHVCHKCGWPFPNHHPSSKQRRAHKRVCGTIYGYRLDNGVQDRARVEGELHSDDELKTPSEKVVERTISTRSSSGVGSKSSQSVKSEEDLFTDAGTEFNGNSDAITREASDGGLLRYYSMQNTNELDVTDLAEENSAGTVALETVQKVEGELNKVGTAISNSPVSADVAVANKNAVDQNLVLSSDPSSELDIISELDSEVISPQEVAKEVSILKVDSIEGKGISNEVADSVSAGISRKASLAESDGVEENSERCKDVDFPGKDKIEVFNEVNPSGNTNSGNSGADENGYVRPLPDVDYKEDKFDVSETTESMVDSKACVVDEGGPVINVTKTGDNDGVLSEHVDVFSMVDKREESINSFGGQNPLLEPDQISDANPCNVDVDILRSEAVKGLKSENLDEEKGISAEEKKHIASADSLFPEGVTMDAGVIQETTPNGDSNVKDNRDVSTVLDHDDTKVSDDNFAVKIPAFAKPAVAEEVASRDLELVDTPTNTELMVDKVSDTALITDGHLHQPRGGEIDSNRESARGGEFMEDKVSDGFLITDDQQLNSTSKLEVNEDAKHFGQNSAVVSHCSNDKFPEKTSGTTEGDGVITQHVTVPAVDAIVDSSSQADSLDGNWGSVSVLSAISDAQPTADTIASDYHPQASPGEESLTVLPKPVIENQPSPNQIPVETEVGIEQMERASEIQTSKEHQSINSALQTDWTPTIADEPVRGNKDKEIIAKVSNWDSGKEHTPLKTLLGEAIARSRSESPVHQNQKDVIPETVDDGFSEKTDNVILNSNHSETEVAGEEMGKEWDSPAKYPVKIKSEKRSKSKPYWAPFLCCSSVNAR